MTETEQEFENFPIELVLPPIVPGATWKWTFYLRDDNGAVIITTGYTLKIELRDRPNGKIHETISTANGKSVNTASEGKFVQTLTAAQTAALAVNHLVWDLLLTDNTGAITPMFRGEINVLSVVTK